MRTRNQENKPSLLMVILALVFVLFFFNTNTPAQEEPTQPTQVTETVAIDATE